MIVKTPDQLSKLLRSKNIWTLFDVLILQLSSPEIRLYLCKVQNVPEFALTFKTNYLYTRYIHPILEPMQCSSIAIFNISIWLAHVEPLQSSSVQHCCCSKYLGLFQQFENEFQFLSLVIQCVVFPFSFVWILIKSGCIFLHYIAFQLLCCMYIVVHL